MYQIYHLIIHHLCKIQGMVWKPAERTEEVEEQRKRFGSAVRACRQKLGMSSRRLASEAGISWRYLSDVELGKRNISLDNIGKLSLALDVPTSMLFRDYGADHPDFHKNLVVYAEGAAEHHEDIAEAPSADSSDSSRNPRE